LNNSRRRRIRSYTLNIRKTSQYDSVQFRQVITQNQCDRDDKYPLHVAKATQDVQEEQKITVKCSRRRVWETRHSGATGWELLSHFSGVWCSSLLQLTSSSNWQRESLFRCQMWQHWMYVPNNVITYENRSRWARLYINLCVRNYITSTIQYNRSLQPPWGI
jgi:hypothetical protein